MEDENKLINGIIRDFPEIKLKIKKSDKHVNIQEDNTKSMCLICRDDTNMKVSCDHYYHEECINEWLKKSNNELCPYCRKQLEINGIIIIDWHYISWNQTLSEEFIREFKDKVDWIYISSHQKLSEEFIRKVSR